MQIDPLNSVHTAPVSAAVRSEDPAATRHLVTAVRALNKSEMYGQDRELQFTRDPGTHLPVIKVVHPGTGEVIDQIPAEQVLQVYEALQNMNGKRDNQ